MEYRICDCGHRNAANDLECVKCDADLSFFPITTITDNQNISKENAEIKEEKHEKEADTASFETDADIETESRPVRTVRMGALKLVSKRDDFEIEIPGDGGLIGREGNCCSDYFQEHVYVSSHHAQIIPSSEGYSIIDQSTNGTKINGMKMDKGTPYPIKAGDDIIFANIGFRVEE